MSFLKRTIFLVQRIGPYHHARLEAWAAKRGGALDVIEFRPRDGVYAWDRVEAASRYVRHATHTPQELTGLFEKLSPGVVVCTGYADAEIRQAVGWALARRVPLVTCSDSTYDDEPRHWFKEGIKRIALQPFAAALAAGTRSRNYLRRLGFADRAIFGPWDVVDNGHFAQKSDEARQRAAELRQGLDLPGRYFLCVARFVSKKNLLRLIDAFARYAEQMIGRVWSLVLSGSGPQETALRAAVAAAGLDDKVRFTGFLQYSELPAGYGLADAFILPSVSDQWGLVVNEAMAAGLPVLVSNRCGCAPDLVNEGENGFTFDPFDTGALAERMLDLTRLSEAQRR